MRASMETLFDLIYLSTVIFLGVRMFFCREKKDISLFGAMALLLGFGDTFHLIPRAYALSTTGLENHLTSLGIGKLIASITMTVFYVVLYQIWKLRYRREEMRHLNILVYFLAGIRILTALCPENGWLSANPPLIWGIVRNIPFALLGLLTIVIYYRQSREQKDLTFSNMWLAVLLSFAFYIPVVLFSEVYPLVGILMIPKTLAYVWIVWMGYRDMKQRTEDANPRPAH